jgi:hypothetical protein|tara:strand:+ start:333 stop:611 length:279 start_codon:yes stop_codon:yes gene_type:complete
VEVVDLEHKHQMVEQVEQETHLIKLLIKDSQVEVDFHFKVTHSEVVLVVEAQQQVVAVGLQQVVLVVLVEHLLLMEHQQLEVAVVEVVEDNL